MYEASFNFLPLQKSDEWKMDYVQILFKMMSDVVPSSYQQLQIQKRFWFDRNGISFIMFIVFLSK